MGLLAALKNGVATPITRWVTLVEVPAGAPLPPGVAAKCEVEVQFVDNAEEFEKNPVLKPHLDDKGIFSFKPEALAAYCAAYCRGVRGFSRYTAALLSGYFLERMHDLPDGELQLENGDMGELGRRMNAGVFVNRIWVESQNRAGFVQDRLTVDDLLRREKKDSPPTSASPSADSPPSTAAA